MKVMVVEDEPDIAKAVKGALEEEAGYEVEVAVGGTDCLQRLRKSRPDIILLDVLMPVMSGVEVLKRLRKDANTKSIPVIAVTAVSAESKIKAELKAIDPDVGFVEKPYDIDTLLKEIRKRAN
jgi:CheY-like chemotaxis protein